LEKAEMRAPMELPPRGLSAQVTDATRSRTNRHRVGREVAAISCIKWIMTPYAVLQPDNK